MSNLTEASLSRVWQHVNSDRPIALLTAFRNEYSQEENVSRNKRLAATIKNLGYGFFFVDGAWIENQGTPDEVHVSEDSLFVIGDPGTDEQFLADIVAQGAKYNQDAVLVKTTAGPKLYDQQGNVSLSLTTLVPGKLGSIYTKLRNNKKSNVFMFEAERDSLGWLQRLAGITK